MNPSVLPTLACPCCRRPLAADAASLGGPRLERGLLACPACRVSVPVLHGFALFREQLLSGAPDPAAELAELDARLFGDPQDYERFLRLKERRPAYDLYAAFQPFNESSQSLHAFVPLARELLRPGEPILDLWCRTGWSGALLAALFPDHPVVSVWEGDCDVLGYRGFRHWLAGERRPANWDVLFHHPGQPLPFADGAFGLVHGLDTLHRYAHRPLISESLRVCREGGLILFPHVHLTNDEPVPFFERGETQLHGTRWRGHLAQVLEGSSRAAVVLSEKDLFERPEELLLEDDADTAHYNACVAIVPRAELGRRLGREERDPAALVDAYAVRNPLVTVHPTTGEARVAEDALAGNVRGLLDRHPMYEERLRRDLPLALDLDDQRVLYQAERLLSAREIAARLGRAPEEVAARLLALEELELVKLAAVPPAMAQLQQYYGTQRVRPLPEEETLGALWRRAVRLMPEAPYLLWAEDGSVFSYETADQIVRQVCAFYRSQGLRPGDRVLLHAIAHPEFHLAFWAAVLSGLVVAAIDPELEGERWQTVVETVRPRLALLRDDRVGAAGALECPVLSLDAPEEGPAQGASFLEAVLGQEGEAELPALAPDQPAVVLFTSGSTGRPKGVALSHGALYRSGALVDRTYAFEEQDRFLASGGPHTMSGLRNACLTPLHAGFTVVLARHDATSGPLDVLSTCVEHGVTVLNTTPAFLSYCVQLGDKARAFAEHRLRMVLCTGYKLTRGLKRQFEQQLGVPVHDYYGLTETAGLCMRLVDPEEPDADTCNGLAVGSLAWIEGADGRPAGPDEPGELVVHSDNLLLGYLSPDGVVPSVQVRGCDYSTADLARRDTAGRIRLEGRKDRMLIDRNGENFHPLEIEQCLAGREDVLDSLVLPYDDAADQEAFAALVVPAEARLAADPEWSWQVERWLREHLPAQHVPAPVVAVAELPAGAAGKWDVERARRLLEEHLGATTEESRWS